MLGIWAAIVPKDAHYSRDRPPAKWGSIVILRVKGSCVRSADERLGPIIPGAIVAAISRGDGFLKGATSLHG
jgi:hypothetical protein